MAREKCEAGLETEVKINRRKKSVTYPQKSPYGLYPLEITCILVMDGFDPRLILGLQIVSAKPM